MDSEWKKVSFNLSQKSHNTLFSCCMSKDLDIIESTLLYWFITAQIASTTLRMGTRDGDNGRGQVGKWIWEIFDWKTRGNKNAQWKIFEFPQFSDLVRTHLDGGHERCTTETATERCESFPSRFILFSIFRCWVCVYVLARARAKLPSYERISFGCERFCLHTMEFFWFQISRFPAENFHNQIHMALRENRWFLDWSIIGRISECFVLINFVH
jgi:uncharacterized protein (DUF1810 family)